MKTAIYTALLILFVWAMDQIEIDDRGQSGMFQSAIWLTAWFAGTVNLLALAVGAAINCKGDKE